MANLQPWKGSKNALNLLVMVVISSAAFATNKIANHIIFNRSDVVSAIGAFTAEILGNRYSHKIGGTAFTSMVTGVLFLVPVSHESSYLHGLVSYTVLVSLAFRQQEASRVTAAVLTSGTR